MQRKVLAGIACSVPAGKIMAATPDSIMSRRPYLAQASRAVDDAVLHLVTKNRQKSSHLAHASRAVDCAVCNNLRACVSHATLCV